MSVRVGILGATGAVGQRFIQLLQDHPTFNLVAVTASESSVGKRYDDAAKWRIETPIPEEIGSMVVTETTPEALPSSVDLLFSSLPSSVAAEVEPDFLEAGYVISSNSSNDRMASDIPLTIPEINPGHLKLIEQQRINRGWDGALVKNPNCSTITMMPTLAALQEFEIDSVHVSTLQAVSGAGYSGVTSMEIIDNAIPHIGGEENKMESESRKILGSFTGANVELHSMDVIASCNRIPTLDGHLENVFVETSQSVSADEAADAMQSYSGTSLYSSPEQLINVFDDPIRPQPRLDRARADGMQISVGGIQQTATGIKYNCLAHNTIRGAAGASLLNAELLVDAGWV
jgi:aspartate-semialdehyde dehydrogenase